MAAAGFEISTDRLVLRSWRSSDAAPFAMMNADVDVMADLGGPLARHESDRKLERFQRCFSDDGITRWVVTDDGGRFMGYCGIVRRDDDHPLGAHHDIGWRLARRYWGQGYASEAASAAIDDAFERSKCAEVLAYTATDNVRSQAVMTRVGLVRRPGFDFTHHYDGFGLWTGLVWSATPSDGAAT